MDSYCLAGRFATQSLDYFVQCFNSNLSGCSPTKFCEIARSIWKYLSLLAENVRSADTDLSYYHEHRQINGLP